MDNEMINSYLRQGNLVGYLWSQGMQVRPLVDDEGNYSLDTIELTFEDPLKDGDLLTFTLVTKEWVSV